MGISSALLFLPELEWWDPAQLPTMSPAISSALGQAPNLPSKAGKPHWSPFLAQQPADSEVQPRPAHGAGCERQRWPCSPQVQARRWQPVSPRAALASWAGWGCSRRQAAPSPQAGEEAAASKLTSRSRKRPPAWDSSARLWERGCLFPAPPMPLQHHQS